MLAVYGFNASRPNRCRDSWNFQHWRWPIGRIIFTEVFIMSLDLEIFQQYKISIYWCNSAYILMSTTPSYIIEETVSICNKG